jgi:hypothetical protein
VLIPCIFNNRAELPVFYPKVFEPKNIGLRDAGVDHDFAWHMI